MFSSVKRLGGAKPSAASLSVIGADTVLNGSVVSGATVHVDGRVDGDVRAEILVLGRRGIVNGNIEAEQARIAGLVDGKVQARIVTLEETARVTGDVTYATLSIAAGAQIDGHLARQEAAFEPEPAMDPLPEAPIKLEKKAVRRASLPLLPALEAPAAPAAG